MTDATRRNFSRPPRNERFAKTTFPGVAFHAAKTAGAAAVPRAIVAGKKHESIFIETKLAQFFKNFADAAIKFLHGVAVKSGAAFFIKIFRRSERLVRQSVRKIKEE